MKMGEVVVSSEGRMDIELATEKDGKKETEKEESSDVVRWERFLPRMVLRVLLVEADDSTRQIISALLRKCSYRVTAVPDGLMAWEILKGRPHNIDLVLTEVELPSISGFALLTLVMEHDIHKKIPVIMMSSRDSISIVLKCMLKGAADFLIKPVRRNELRNLWQHVWRRHCLLGGHAPQNLPSVHYKAEAISENSTASNHSSDYAISAQKNKGSEKEVDAQSSCASPCLEAENAYVQNMHGLSQLKSRSPNFCNTDVEKHDERVKMETESLMPESKTGGEPDEMLVSEKLNRSHSEIAHCADALGQEEDHACFKTMPEGEGRGPQNDRRNANATSVIHGCNDELIGPSSGAIDLIGTFDNPLKSSDGISTLNDCMNKFEFSPQLELSLRKSFPSTSKDLGKDERHTLNHSTASAFSWYNNSKTFPTLTSNFTELKEGTIKSGEMLSHQLSENATGSPQPCGVTSSNTTSLMINQSGQAEVPFSRTHLGFYLVPGVSFDNVSAGYSHVFPPLFYTQSGLPPAWTPKSHCQREHSPFSLYTPVHLNRDIYDSEQDFRRSSEITHDSIDQTVHEQNEVERLEESRRCSPATGQSANGNLCNGLANNNSNGTCEGVCNGTDGNPSSAKVIEKETAPQNLYEGTLFIHDGFRGIRSNWSSQREAALTKFRLKRKDRCYEKKVRYQSRKSLAEQRPRVKGQFVRQVKCDAKVANAEDGP